MIIKRSTHMARLVVLVAMVAGCGGEQSAQGPADAPAVGETAKYDWYMDGSTPAGSSTIVTTGDGRITNASFVHWNNREYTLDSELQLDERGFVVAQKITGTGPFGAAIDETFHFEDGVAVWRTPGEGGSVTTDEAAFYMPNEWAAIESLAALVRVSQAGLEGEVPLFPSGSARVEKLVEQQVAAPEGPQTLSLYAVSGLDFTPRYAWFDADLDIAAIDIGGYFGMLPEGWSKDVLADLSRVQTEQNAKLIERIAGDLAILLDRPVVFDGVAIVDVEAGTLLEGRHVRVEDGKIIAVSDTPIDAPGAIRIDGGGRTLLPGLWDMHGHFGLSDGVLNIAGGITSVRDIGSVHEQIMEITRKYDSGAVIGPHTYRAGFIDRAGPYASGWSAETLEEALDRVDFFAGHGYMQIKLYSSIEPGWVEPIAKRAHERGMRVSGHIPAFMSAEQAVRAGYDEIQHINMVFLNFLAGDREDTRKQLRFTLYGDEAGNLDLESDEVREFIALLKENDVVIDPTAAIFDTMLRHLPGDPDPTFAAVIDRLPLAVRRPLYNPEMDMSGRVDAWARSARQQAAMLKLLYDSGIRLVPGSDHMAAFTLHRELEVYGEAGIPAAAVLRMATLGSAEVVGAAERTGSIEVGKDADLLLVEGNPLEDLSAVRRGVLVVKRGTAYRPDELYRAVGVVPLVESVEL